MLLKVTENIATLKNNESSITVTDLGAVKIYSTTITLRPTHGDARTTINEEN